MSCCKEMERRVERGSVKRSGEWFQINTSDGYTQKIDYCPWCGKKLDEQDHGDFRSFVEPNRWEQMRDAQAQEALDKLPTHKERALVHAVLALSATGSLLAEKLGSLGTSTMIGGVLNGLGGLFGAKSFNVFTPGAVPKCPECGEVLAVGVEHKCP